MLMVLTNIAVISPAHTESSNTAASVAPIKYMITVSIAEHPASQMAALSILFIMMVHTADMTKDSNSTDA